MDALFSSLAGSDFDSPRFPGRPQNPTSEALVSNPRNFSNSEGRFQNPSSDVLLSNPCDSSLGRAVPKRCIRGPVFESLQFPLPKGGTEALFRGFPGTPEFSGLGMASGARWGSPEVSWADSCLVDDGSDDADNRISLGDFGGRNAPPAWIPVPGEERQGFPIPAISPFRETGQGRADEVFQAWNWNSLDFDEDFAASSLLNAQEEEEEEEEEEPLNIFQTWDLNTESPRGRGDDLLEFLAWTVARSGQDGSPSMDGSEPSVSPPPAVDVFDLNALSSTLEEEAGLDSLIAGMADLNIAVSPNI